MTPLPPYNFLVYYSTKDACFIARVAEFPSLSAHHDGSPAYALQELEDVVGDVVTDLQASPGEDPPPPFPRATALAFFATLGED